MFCQTKCNIKNRMRRRKHWLNASSLYVYTLFDLASNWPNFFIINLSEALYKKGDLRNFSKFTEKHLGRIGFYNTHLFDEAEMNH